MRHSKNPPETPPAGRSEDERALLLHELDHRVKNNLQLIASLVMLQMRRTEEPAVREALGSMLERLNAIGIVHRRLFESEELAQFDVADFLRDLATDLVDASHADIALELDLQPVAVALQKAAPFALLLNELISNAVRHAFPDGPGSLSIKIVKLPGNFRIEIRDDGVGLRDSGEISGFGRTIVDLLSRQLQAQVTWEDAQPGVRVCVTLPVGGD